MTTQSVNVEPFRNASLCLGRPFKGRSHLLQLRERSAEQEGVGFRVLSLLFLVACVWVGIEIHTQGMDRAFGGALAGLGSGGRSHAESILARVRGSATGARDRQLERIERQLEDGSIGLQDRSAHVLED